MPPHPLSDFETQRYYQKETRFTAVYSRIIYVRNPLDSFICEW